MARLVLLPNSSSSFFIITIFVLITITPATPATLATGKNDNHGFPRLLDPNKVLSRNEKFSHFRFYWHDIVGGGNPTSVAVVRPPTSNSSTFFGQMNMIDNPLTEGPELSSKLVGKAQGFYASASQQEVGLLMAMNFAFVTGKYNGSTITVLGRNAVFSEMREMPVIGGSGLFRFARGYVQARTHTFDLKTGDATVEYNVFVLHY